MCISSTLPLLSGILSATTSFDRAAAEDIKKMKTHSLETKAANGCGKRNAHQKWPKANLIMSMISRDDDFCVFRFLLFIYRYGSSLSVYSTRRRTLATVSQTISFNYCILY